MPRDMSRQEFDAIAAKVAQSAPEGLSRQEFDELVVAEALKASGYEQPLTRERPPAGAPSALSAGHHPETIAGDDRRAKFLQMIEGAETPSDAEFLKRGPEVGGALGMAFGGPLGAAAGAGVGSLAKGQHTQGAHVPTGSDAATAGGDALWNGLLASVVRGPQLAAQKLGPVVAKHAGPIAKGVSALTGIGSGIASGNLLTGLGAASATRMATDPRMVRGAANLATRGANAVPTHVANKIGFGALSADAFRKALLDALGAEPPASTDR
jgi:hypothetical protein